MRAAFAGLGLALPAKRLIVNLAPADTPKEGSHYDLPIALCVMAAMGVVPPDALSSWMAFGELSLDGRIAPTAGALPAAMAASAHGLGLICPEASGPEAAWAGDVPILAPRSLIAIINHFRGTQVLGRAQARSGAGGRTAAGSAGREGSGAGQARAGDRRGRAGITSSSPGRRDPASR